jgi:hypothetical protein
MPNRSQTFGFAVLLIVLCACPLVLYGNPPAAASIVISQPGRKPTTLTFTPNDLAQVERDPKYVWKKLGAANSKCCANARRASSCIWICCNGTKIRTCDVVLVKAMMALHKDPT